MTSPVSGSYPQALSGGGGSQWWTFSGSTPGTIPGAVNNDMAVGLPSGETFKLIAGAWVDQAGSIAGPAGTNGTNGAPGSPGTPGTPGNAVQGVPALNGLALQTFNPLLGVTGYAPPSGRGYFLKAYAPSALTITNLVPGYVTVGAGLTYARLAVFNSAGTMLCITADQSTAWTSLANSGVACPVQPTAGGSATPYSWAGGGYFYLAFLCVGTTSPTIWYPTSNVTALSNIGTSLAAANFTAAYITALASLNGPMTWTSGILANPFWIGLS